MRDQEHRYEVYEFKYGFKVVPRERRRAVVFCRLSKNGFWNFTMRNQLRYQENIPLYNFYNILNITVALLYETWKPNKKSKSAIKERIIVEYCVKTTSKTLNKKIHDIWERKCNIINPKVRELHKKLYSVSNGSGNWSKIDYLLKNKKNYEFLIDDMIKYRAARISILHGREGEPDSDWMKLYSIYGNPYTSLRKTLMNLPNGVTYHRLFNLNCLKLPEPATTRMRLWAYCAIGSNYRIEKYQKEKFAHIVEKSNDEQIKKAIRYIWKYFPTEKTGDFRRSDGIWHALTMIFDYPHETGNWDILGLAKRAEVYHYELQIKQQKEQEEWDRKYQEQQARRAMEEQAKREKQREEQKKFMPLKTALPPIPLPKIKEINFLDTFGMIVDEGCIMSHCIATYAKSAVAGRCYLFHVDYKGEMASVEVSPNGYVQQSYGPHDRDNLASEYGKRVLGKWAKELQKTNKKPILREKNEKESNVSGPAWDWAREVEYNF